MTLYERILVPTDGSDEGKRAVVHALELATVHGAAVDALYVVNTASYAGMPMETSWEGVDDLLRADADAAVSEVEALAANYDVAVTTAVVDGSPSREIIRYAESEGCDLIVMGTHGRGGIDRLLLGSVTEKVVRGSEVPVLTVRVSAELTPTVDAAESVETTTTTDTVESVETAEPTDPAGTTESTNSVASGAEGSVTETGTEANGS